MSPALTDKEDLVNKVKELQEYLNTHEKPHDSDEDYSAGVGACGTFTVDDNRAIPENTFFKPGKTFEIRTRYSNLSGSYTILSKFVQIYIIIITFYLFIYLIWYAVFKVVISKNDRYKHAHYIKLSY